MTTAHTRKVGDSGSDPGPGTGERFGGPGGWLSAAIYFGLALIYFLPAFLPGRHIFGTDYTNSSYFYYDFISLQTAGGGLPGWIPYVYGGVPFFANPGSTFYPIRWIADALGPTTFFFPFLFLIHFGVAGWGMYLLARELGCRKWVAFVTGLCFQWTGVTASWVYAGHDGRIIVVTLAPLLFYFLHRGVRTAKLAPFVGAAGTTGFALLSFQIQNAYYLLLAALLWGIFCIVHFGLHNRPRVLGKVVALGVGAVAFGFLTAAVNFLPFQRYVSESPRGMTGGRGYEFSTSYSMPPRAIIGVAVPEQVGATVQNDRGEYVFPVYRGENPFRLHTEYLGGVVLVLFALGFAFARQDSYWRFFAGLGAFALTLALGGNTPLYRVYYALLPGLDRFRAPDLAYFVVALSVICMAAVTLERLAARRDQPAPRTRAAENEKSLASWILWIGGGVAGAALLGALTAGAGSAEMAEGTVGLSPMQGWLRFALFAGAATGILWMWAANRLRSPVVLVVLSIVTTVDLWMIGQRFFLTTDAPSVMYAEDDVTAFLGGQEGPFRFWAIPGQTAWPRAINLPMRYELENAGGEHGNQLHRYNEFIGTSAAAMADFHNFGDARFLAAANVRFLVISAQLEVPWLQEVYRGSSAIVYENTVALPRAFLVGDVAVTADPDRTLGMMQDTSWMPHTSAVVEATEDLGLPGGSVAGGAEVVLHSPDRVVVETAADRPALLVLSDNFYEDWRASLDGEATTIYRTNHTFRGVVVPAGEHTVEFTFEPTRLYRGLYIYLACLGILAVFGLLHVRSLVPRRSPPPATQ